MKTLGALTLGLAALIPASVVAAPAESSGGCFVPQIIYSTLEKPFTLTALTGPKFSSRDPWWLLLRPRTSSDKVPSYPVISRTKIAPPTFRLTNGKLTSNGIEADVFATTLQFPPPLRGWAIGGNVDGATTGTFAASYRCDAEGNAFLRLRAEDGASGFAVERVSENSRVYIKPAQFAGDATSVELKINQQQ